jgi:hypothetical protein
MGNKDSGVIHNQSDQELVYVLHHTETVNYPAIFD